jgi:hypothetical protein
VYIYLSSTRRTSPKAVDMPGSAAAVESP